MAYLENVGRSILTWEIAATCTCRRNEETGSQSKGKGVWNFWERRTGWGIQAWVLGGDILRVTFPEGLHAPLSTWRDRTCTFWGLKNSPWTPDICCCLLLAFLTPFLKEEFHFLTSASLTFLPPVLCPFSQAWTPAGILPFSSLAMKFIHSALI